MSVRPARPSDAAASAASRDRSLIGLLDPNDFLPGHTTADLYSLRHLTLRGGLPDSPSWVRAQAWKVLLGYLPPEKKEWTATLAKRRREYYQFLSDFAPSLNNPDTHGTLSDTDAMLEQIYKDLSRSRKNGFAFYQAVSKSSSSCPISPLPEHTSDSSDAESSERAISPVKRLDNRHHVLRRLALINRDFARSLHTEKDPNEGSRDERAQAPRLLHHDTLENQPSDLDSSAVSASESSMIHPPILLSPPSPGALSRSSSQHSFASANDILEEASLASVAEEMALNDTTSSSPLSRPNRIPDLQDRNWHSLLRILYLFALLNPSIGYVQGMNEALFTLVYVFGKAAYPCRDTIPPSHSAQSNLSSAPNLESSQSEAVDSLREWDNEGDLAELNSHAEADAFWCFSTLIGEVRELYEFDELSRSTIPTSTSTGMAGILARFSLQLKWLDRELWADLRSYNLDPRLPYYSVRWLACLLSTELSLPSLTRVWDTLLAEQEQGSTSTSAKIEFLIDVSCAMLLNVKDRLPSGMGGSEGEREAFSYGMRFLQSYPDDDISPVLELAALFRQRRLAADLTGDGPPLHDEEDVLAPGPASVKTRAAKALREWANPSFSSPSVRKDDSPQTDRSITGHWFGSVGLGGDPNVDTGTPDMSFGSNIEDISITSTASKASFTEMFAKYADAVQRSDAAANLSKTSTNLTAKAMAHFGDRSSRESTSEASFPGGNMHNRTRGSRIASLGAVSAGLFNKGRRAVSTSTSASAGPDSPRTPDMNHWSEEVMPHFPLPNVSDSPSGRMEYVDTTGKRNSTMNGARSHRSPAPLEASGQGEGSHMLPLPSMRAAAKLGMLSRQNDSGSPVSRVTGPKPLLLSQSARPPREASNGSASSLLLSEEPSRKVSSGPMAHNMSRGNSQQDGRSSVADSFSGRSSRSVSNAGSRRSSVGSPDTSMLGLQQAGELPPLPSLMAQKADVPLSYSMRPVGGESPLVPRKTSSGSVGLQGLASNEGKAPAGAFGRSSKATTGIEAETVRPSFGQVSSSSDVPLVATGSTSISRPRLQNRKRTSGSTIDSRSASISESVNGNKLSNGLSLNTDTDEPFGFSNLSADHEMGMRSATPPGLEHSSIAAHRTRHRSRPDPERSWSLGEAVRLQDTPMAENTIDYTGPTESMPDVQRYALSDELPNIGSGETKHDEQARHMTSNPTSIGIGRSKRMGKARTASSSSVASRRSLASVGAGLRRSSRTSVHEQTPSSPTPLPELEEDVSVYDGMVAEPKYSSSGTTTYPFDALSPSAEPEAEDGEHSDMIPARPSLDSYISAADQYVNFTNSHNSQTSSP